MARVGLVGFGMAGRVFHAPLISSVDGLELAAVVERHSDQAAQRYLGIKTCRSLEESAGRPQDEHPIAGRRQGQAVERGYARNVDAERRGHEQGGHGPR